MKKPILIVLFLICNWLKLVGSQEIVIAELPDSPLSQLVNQHMEFLIAEYFQKVSVEDWHIVANVIITSFEYTQSDFKYNKLLTKLLKTMWHLKMVHEDETQDVLKKLTRNIRKLNRLDTIRDKARTLWHIASGFLNVPEQKNALLIFEAIAEERVKIIQEYLQNNEGLLFNSCKQTHEINAELAIKINSIANSFKALLELPYPGELSERAFAILNSSFSMALKLEEQYKLITSIMPILHHVEDITLMSITLDSLYYARMYELLKKTSDTCRLVFDSSGFIPQEKRTQELPAVNI